MTKNLSQDSILSNFTEGLKLLHSVDREGQLHVGVDSFILIWKQLNYLPWGAMASLVSFYPVRKIAGLATYNIHFYFRKSTVTDHSFPI